MKKLLWLWLFMGGGSIYVIIELIWRQRTHWTMFILGGLCFLTIACLNQYLKTKIPLPIRCVIGAVFITLIEFIAGCILNLWAKMNIWDYSTLRFQLLGQISLRYSALWFLLTVPSIGICNGIFRLIDVRENN